MPSAPREVKIRLFLPGEKTTECIGMFDKTAHQWVNENRERVYPSQWQPVT